MKPRKPERCPWSKIHTSAPNAALSESAFINTALNGRSAERSKTVSTISVVMSTKPIASGVWLIMYWTRSMSNAVSPVTLTVAPGVAVDCADLLHERVRLVTRHEVWVGHIEHGDAPSGEARHKRLHGGWPRRLRLRVQGLIRRECRCRVHVHVAADRRHALECRRASGSVCTRWRRWRGWSASPGRSR